MKTLIRVGCVAFSLTFILAFWVSAGMAQTEWEKYPGNPVLDIGVNSAGNPTVLFDGTEYKMWYSSAEWASEIGYATSPDGIVWTTYPGNPVLEKGSSGFEDNGVHSPTVLFDGTEYKMWYSGNDGSHFNIGLATSPDGIVWTKCTVNPVLTTAGGWEARHVHNPTVLFDGTEYKMWYAGDSHAWVKIGYATSPDGIVWTKYPGNPVLGLGPSESWEDDDVSSPHVLFDGIEYKMWYSGDAGQQWRLGYATSPDGIVWTKYPGNPVLGFGQDGTWDERNIGAPSVLFDGIGYQLWYMGGRVDSQVRTGYAISLPDCVDLDGDGSWDVACGGWDCDDLNPIIHLGAEEFCDEVDWDCTGDPLDRDFDGDGHIDGDLLCMGDDCDDLDPYTYPGAPELCDDKDNDCDGMIEADVDVDGWMDCEGDCDDADPEINPGAVETCDDGIDNDCDGLVDDDDMDCAPYILEMDVSYSTVGPGMLDMGFRIAAAEQCVWVNVAITVFPTFQMIPLWMDVLPATHPAEEMALSFPFPDIGWVGMYSGLYHEGVMQVYDAEWVYAGK